MLDMSNNIKKRVNGRNMLKTPQERVRLLKNGMEAKKIEELYIKYNNFKIIHAPILFDLTQPLKRIEKKNAKK